MSKIVAVCGHCRHHDKEGENSTIEFNFRDGKIYYICPECKKESSISLKVENKPYPKVRGM
jgi:hypothetical protein